MQSSIQSIISKNPFSLPAICLVSIVIWLFAPTKDMVILALPDHGLWYLLPESIQKGLLGNIIGLTITSVLIYAMVEFSNTLVLLRVSSRMLSTMLAMLMGVCLCLHKFQPAHLVMLASLFSYLYLFSSYQKTSPALSFSTHFFLSLASLVCPKMLVYVIPLWLFQAKLSALDFKGVVASLIALVTPYWFFFAFAVLNDRIDIFIDFFVKASDIIMPSSSILKESQVAAGVLVAFSFLLGAIHFIFTKSQDKLRQRSIFEIVTLHGFIIAAMLFLMPQCFNLFLGLLIIDTAVMGGRFWVVCDNKFANNLFILNIIVAIIIIALSINM